MALVYLTLQQAVEIHAKTVEVSGGGAFGHLELGKLDSVLQHIQNDDYYPTIEDKLTHLYLQCVQVPLLSGRQQTHRDQLVRSDVVTQWIFVLRQQFYTRNGEHQLSRRRRQYRQGIAAGCHRGASSG